MARSIMRTFCASLLAMLCVDAASAQTYYARSRISPLKKVAGSTTTPTKTCAPGDPSSWSTLRTAGAYQFNTTNLTRVGAAPDRSPQLQRICEQAIAGSSRTQCQVQGQGGFNVDVYITKVDGTVPVDTLERDNAIVYEVITCS